MKLSNATLMYSTYMNMYVGGVQGNYTYHNYGKIFTEILGDTRCTRLLEAV